MNLKMGLGSEDAATNKLEEFTEYLISMGDLEPGQIDWTYDAPRPFWELEFDVYFSVDAPDCGMRGEYGVLEYPDAPAAVWVEEVKIGKHDYTKFFKHETIEQRIKDESRN